MVIFFKPIHMLIGTFKSISAADHGNVIETYKSNRMTIIFKNSKFKMYFPVIAFFPVFDMIIPKFFVKLWQ